MWNAGLDETQAGIKIARRNINNLRYADDTTLMAESKEELKSLLMKVKEESRKVGLKLNIQKMKIMASSPITSWQIDGETMKTVRDFILVGSQIIASLPYSSVGKDVSCNARGLGSIAGLGRCSGEGNGNPLQYSCLENLMDRRARRATVHGVARIRHDFVTKSPPLKLLQMVTAAMKLKDACSLEENLWPPRQHIKKQRHYFANKGLFSQGYGFSSGHIWMWELDYKESWAPKNWCFYKDIKPVHPKGN